MSMLLTLFFIEANLQLSINSQQITGISNKWVDCFCLEISKYFCKLPVSTYVDIHLLCLPLFCSGPWTQHGLDGSTLLFSKHPRLPIKHSYQVALQKLPSALLTKGEPILLIKLPFVFSNFRKFLFILNLIPRGLSLFEIVYKMLISVLFQM